MEAQKEAQNEQKEQNAAQAEKPKAAGNRGKGRPKGSLNKKTKALLDEQKNKIRRQDRADEKHEFIQRVIEQKISLFEMGKSRVQNDDELCDRLNLYFRACADKASIPSYEGMCLALGYPKVRVNELCRGIKTYRWVTPYTADIVNKAKDLMAAIDAELAAEGKTQPVVYMFRAKNFYGMTDSAEVNVQLNAVVAEKSAESLIAEAAMLPDGVIESTAVEVE